MAACCCSSSLLILGSMQPKCACPLVFLQDGATGKQADAIGLLLLERPLPSPDVLLTLLEVRWKSSGVIPGRQAVGRRLHQLSLALRRAGGRGRTFLHRLPPSATSGCRWM